MEIEELVHKKKKLYSTLLNYMDSYDYENEFSSLINIFENQAIFKNQEDTLDLIYLLSSIEENYHRTKNFYDKIERIFNFIMKEKKFQISNSKLFQIFKKSKRMLLLLLEKKILIPDELIINQIFQMKDQNNHEYSVYLYSGIKTYINEIKQAEIEKIITNKYNEDIETFKQKCQIGENDSYICSLIRQDSIEDFISYANRTNYSLSNRIKSSIFETNSFLIDKEPTLLEYAAFFGSIQIIHYLNLKQVELTPELWLYSIHSNTPEIIHFCEEMDVPLKEECEITDIKYFRNYPSLIYCFQITTTENEIKLKILKEAVKCHHNNIYNYMKNTIISQKVEELYNDIFESYIINYHNYDFYPVNIDEMISKQKKCSGFNIKFLCPSLTKITIPSSVSLISKGAFYGCSNVKEFIIPSSVKKISDDAFGECSSLIEINLPHSVTKIGNDAFKGCLSLRKITFPCVTSIGNNAFEGCISLVEIEIPSTMTSIGKSVFYGCTSLENVKIHPNLKSIGNFCFCKCSSLKEINIPFYVNSIGKHAFEDCSSLKKIEIPNSVNLIDECTFNGCLLLEQVHIPQSVKKIYDFAFKNCKSLKQILIPESVIYISENAFL